MALATQPNGSSIVPLAGSPLTTNGTPVNLSSQTQNTIVQNTGGTDVETVKLIKS